MTIQTLYPVFESGQVLTEEALNTIIAYLEPQDRLTRSRLTGIGICCGLVPELRLGGAVKVVLGRGVAVTSEGYLIAQGETAYVNRRRYLAPVPSGDVPVEEIARARYPFLFDGAVQREAWEMLEQGAELVAGAAQPEPLDAEFLADKVVMLFLEERRDALKNCDVNDCSDKGASLQLTLRPLLITRGQADTMLAQEAALVPGIPVDRASHPRLGLQGLDLPRLLPVGSSALTFPALFARQVALALTGLRQASARIFAAQTAYGHVLTPDFDPAGPPRHQLLPLPGHWAMMPLLAQSLVDGVRDLGLALDEALAAAARMDAECHPDARRFPRHVLAGRVLPPDPPFADAPTDFAALAGFDPSTIVQGPRAGMPPAPQRHHFIPAPPLSGQAALRFRTLWHRLSLMAQSYHASDLVGADIRLSPSRHGIAPLGDRAIPAHYKVAETSTLVANWSFERRRNPSAPAPTGYRLLPAAAGKHPLLRRDDAVDFIRIEGVAGRPLGQAWASILRQKRNLGLGFAVQPVLVTLGDEADEPEISEASKAFAPFLACQTKDLTSQLRVAAAGLMPFLLWLMRSLASIEAGRSIRPPDGQTTPRPPELPEGLGFSVLITKPAEATLIRRLGSMVTEQLVAPVSGGTLSLTRRVLEGAGELQAAPATGSVLALVESVNAGGVAVETLESLRHIALAEGLNRFEAEARAIAVLPGVTLLKQTEAVIEALGQVDVARLPEADLERRVAALMQAYDSYADRAETDPARAGEATARINREIVASKATLSALAAPLAGNALAAEAQRRLRDAFDDMVLPAFARHHPALDHQGGTPATGTFVLLVCSYRMVEPMLQAALAGVQTDFEQTWSGLFGSAPPGPDLNAAVAAIKGAAQGDSGNHLNHYVVLGDLCLPTQCCDALCAEDAVIAAEGEGRTPPFRPIPFPIPEPIFDPRLDVRPGPLRPEPDPSRPVGPAGPQATITGRVTRRNASGRSAAVPGAEIMALSGQEIFQSISGLRGAYELSLPEGQYRLAARLGDERGEPVAVTLRGGETMQLDLTL